ncbi:MAG: hypothetical protein ACHQIG_03795 [Acidimicrobiia bacterium]
MARTATCDCRWVIDLDVVVDGTHRTVRVDDNSKPFHTSGGRPGVPEYIWAFLSEHNRFQIRQPDGSYVPVAP